MSVRIPRGLLILLAVVGTTLAVGGGPLLAAGPTAPPTRQQIAQRLLLGHGRFMTAPARAALAMIARGDQALASGLAGGVVRGKAVSGGTAAPAPAFTNVRVNDPAEDSHQVDQTTQSETAVAVSGSNVVVGYNDSQRGLLFLTAGADITGYSYSSDGGSTWTDGGALPNAPAFVNLGDPWLASDRSGAIYFANLAIDGMTGNLTVGAAKSTDGGRTFTPPVTVSPPESGFFLYEGDKEAMTVGPDPSAKTRDDVYVAWDDFACDINFGCYNGLPVAHSADGGATWQTTYADKFSGDPNAPCSFHQFIGAVPIVDSKNGTLYVVAEKISVNDPTPDCSGNAPTTFSESVFRSTDGGNTFGPEVKIADVTSSTGGFGAFILGPGQLMRNLEFPSAAIRNNTLYVAWNDGASGNSHVRLAASNDGGASWSLSWATQGTNDEIQPALSADNGGLHLLYYRRNPDDRLDVFVANSTNASSWVARRVTTVSFPGVYTQPQFDPIIAFGYMGDYIANTSDGSHEYFAWGDNRDTVTNFLWPAGRNDPNVYFARQ